MEEKIICEVTSIDGLTAAQRRARYDTKKCNTCGAKYKVGLTGWYVPEFGSYIDTIYECPKCLAKIGVEHRHKNKRLREIPTELRALNEELSKIPYNAIYEEGGDYRYAYTHDNSLNEFKSDVREYKNNKKQILIDRAKRLEISTQIAALEKEKANCLRGSSYHPVANT